MASLATDTLPLAIITFISNHQSVRQRQLDEWLSTQPNSTPILRINNHQPLTAHHIKRWSLDDIITLPMSLEQQLQSTLNYLQTYHEYRILIIETCETLPLSTMTALKHLAQQQHKHPKPPLQIVLCGAQNPYHHARINSSSPLSSDTKRERPTTTTRHTEPSQSHLQQAPQAIIGHINQHSIKIISLSLLGILIYILWQVQHHPNHPHNTLPLIPNAQLTNPAHSRQATRFTKPPEVQSPVKKQPITTSTHYTLQWASSHDSAATKALQQKLHLADSRVIEVMQNNRVRFILISGNYKTIHQAKLALQALPASIHTEKPWIRPIKAPSVQ